MKRLIRYPVVLVALSTGLNVQGAEDLSAAPGYQIEQFRTLIRETMEESRLVGVGAALILGDDVIWKEGFGFADIERNVLYTPQTTQPIGSITKPITAFGIMQLHERGSLNIDHPLMEYLPQFSVGTRGMDLRDITVRSVLSHTSGLPNEIYFNAALDTDKYTNVVTYLKDEILAFPPGTIYHYSNIGYCLLGHTILSVSNQDYPDYMQRNIFQPIGMTNTGFIGCDHLQNISRAYDADRNPVEFVRVRSTPAGALYSNIDDLVVLAQEIIAIYHGKAGGFIAPNTLRETFREQRDSALIMDRKEGLGWTMFTNESGIAVLHFGSDNVASAGLIIAPEQKMAAAILTNTAGGGIINDVLTAKFLECCGFKDKDHEILHEESPQKNKIIELTADLLKRHVGIYPHTRALIGVSLEKQELVLKADFGTFELKPVSPDEFIPCKVISPEETEMMMSRRVLFKDVEGYHVLSWEDAAGSRKPLAYKLGPQVITQAWKHRMGRYEVVGQQLAGVETFSRAEISVSGSGVLQLKISYTSGDYVYNLRIETDDELVVCGFDDITGGDTLRFSRDKGNDLVRIYGLTMQKIE